MCRNDKLNLFALNLPVYSFHETVFYGPSFHDKCGSFAPLLPRFAELGENLGGLLYTRGKCAPFWNKVPFFWNEIGLSKWKRSAHVSETIEQKTFFLKYS